MIKTLLSGCSLSDWCGFGQSVERENNVPLALIGNHADPRCWYNIVKDDFDNLDNQLNHPFFQNINPPTSLKLNRNLHPV
jgi:hypothetical protein